MPAGLAEGAATESSARARATEVAERSIVGIALEGQRSVVRVVKAVERHRCLRASMVALGII